MKAERTKQLQAVDAEWHLELARQAYRSKDCQTTLSHVEKILRIRPDWLPALRLRAALAMEYEQDDGRAIPFLEKLVQKDEGDSDAIFNLAYCLFQQCRYAEEIALLEKYQERLKGRRDKEAREDKKKIQDWLSETRFYMERAGAPSFPPPEAPPMRLSRQDTAPPRRQTTPPRSSQRAVVTPAGPTGTAGPPLPRGPAEGAATAMPWPTVMAAMKKWARQKAAPATPAGKNSPGAEAVAGPMQTSLFPPDEELPKETAGGPEATSSVGRAPGKTLRTNKATRFPERRENESSRVLRSSATGKAPVAARGVATAAAGELTPAAKRGFTPPVIAPSSPAATPAQSSTSSSSVSSSMFAPAAPAAPFPAPAPALPVFDLAIFSDPRNLQIEAPLHVREAGEDFAARIAAAPPAAPEDYLLHLQYRRLRLVREFEELLCLDQLRGVNHYWYQVETVAAVLKRFRGRVLLADEVGLGKTIEAGMLIKEYLLRGLVRKVLILTPPTLVSQWREEMEEKFGLPFVTPDHQSFRAEGERFWRDRDLVIASINTAKSQRYFDVLTDIDYDLVVVDEAHYLRNRQTRNHRLVGALRKRFIFLLSATPVQNNLLELYNLITLLQPGLLSTEAAFKKEYVKRGSLRQPQNPETLRQLLREVMVRNTRSMVDVKLPKRFAATFYVPPTAAEKETYEELSAALRRYHEAAATPELFTVRNLQMAAGSSPFALRDSLDRLCARLAAGINREINSGIGPGGGRKGDIINGGLRDDLKGSEDGSGKRGKRGRGNGGGALAAGDHGDPAAGPSNEDDIEEIAPAEGRSGDSDPDNGTWRTFLDLFAGISRKLEGIIETSKGRQLLTLVRQNQEKKLIFVRYRRTLAYLERLLREHGYPCAVFSGDMTAREKDEAVAAFRDDVPILLSTETGGEGRNIQFCNTLINYDLPWNPMRLEQRIGRIHRIGQERDVFIFNLCLQGSIEEFMMRILDDKINMFELVIGEIDTILGNLETEQDFSGLILDVWLRSGAGEERQANFARLGDEILAAKRTYEKTKALDEMIFGDDYEV